MFGNFEDDAQKILVKRARYVIKKISNSNLES